MNRREVEKKLEGKLSERDIKIILDYSLGVTQSAIGRELNITRARVGQLMDRIVGTKRDRVIPETTLQQTRAVKKLIKPLRMSWEYIGQFANVRGKSVRQYMTVAQRNTPTMRAMAVKAVLRATEAKLQEVEDILDEIEEAYGIENP